MLTLLLGYIFSVIFEDSVIQLFQYDFYFRILTFSGACVGWFYQEHVRRDYEITGAKKFILEHTFRYKVFTQILLVCKYFCGYTHVTSILEFGTFLALFGLYCVIFINHNSPQLKRVERITVNNYLRFYLRGVYQAKNMLIKIRHLTLNEKLFFSVSFLLIRYLLKTYFWLDFFVFFRLFFLIASPCILIFSCFLLNYLIYNYSIPNYPKNVALLIKLLAKKIIFYSLLVLVSITLILSDIVIQHILNENFFKEIFFKILFFLVQIS